MRTLCTFGVRGIVVNVSSHPENWSSVNGIEQTFICIHGGKSTLNENNTEKEREEWFIFTYLSLEECIQSLLIVLSREHIHDLF